MPPLIFLLRKVFCFPFSVEQLPRRFHLEKFLRRVRLTHHLFRGIGGQCPPYISFHFLRVGQRPMHDCLEKSFVGCVLRTIAPREWRARRPALPDFAPLMGEVEGPGTTAPNPKPRFGGLIF